MPKHKKLTDMNQDEVDILWKEAKRTCDDNTKVDTLFLIFDTKITTRILEEREFDILKETFCDALSFQEPSLRQTFLAITNKAIKRLNDGHRKVMRESTLYDDNFRREITERYMQFLEWLINFCFDSIYCNAYFGSFILTISTLKRVIEHITFDNEELPIRQFFYKKRCYDSILSCLNDSFEENKLLALELLLMMPYNEQFINEENMKSFRTIAYSLVSSVNPAHSLTCQYVFKLLIGLQHKDLLKKGTGDPLIRNQIVYEHLDSLVQLVEDGVRETRDNFVIALKNNAIYPKLTCIRALLDEVAADKLEQQREQWEKLVKRIVNASIEACQAVSTIVCNLNPETIGHLSMDLKPLDAVALAKDLNVSIDISDAQFQTITSQMLLISGWKTIKECSLSMGAMCTRFWWPKERIKAKLEKFPGFHYPPILSSDDIMKIINFFDHYLRNLRHRGAFEQAYKGFLMVTKRVWHDPHLSDLLINTLKEIMNDFKSELTDSDDKKVEYLKAYVTRRSAGLPFIVQAIVNSEGRSESKTLCWVMESLFEVLEEDKTETYQRIHCLNILRALIKEHHLGEKVIPFTERTLSITMEAFKSDSFPIRNCANMLLKAAVDRTFGVNRLRDDIHKRNKLSFERFFCECPKLHAKMLRHLEDGLKERRSLASVHSVFIVLSRLNPSLNPSEEFTNEKIIEPFIEPLTSLALSCPDYKLRESAANLAVQLQTYCQRIDQNYIYKCQLIRLRELFMKSGCISFDDMNRFHGALLMIRNWIKVYLQTFWERDGFRKATMVEEEISAFTRDLVSKILLHDQVADPQWSPAEYNVTTVHRQFSYDSVKIIALDIVENYCLNHLIMKVSLFEIIESACDQIFIKLLEFENRNGDLKLVKPPHLDQYGFRLLTLGLTLFASVADSVRARKFLHLQTFDGFETSWKAFWYRYLDLVLVPGRVSSSMRAALIRCVNQFLHRKSDKFLKKLHSNMDMDTLASFVTPFEKMEKANENDNEHKLWLRYFSGNVLGLNCTGIDTSQLFRCPEFDIQVGDSDVAKFSAKISNTPTAVEILALACELSKDPKKDIDSCQPWLAGHLSRNDLLDFVDSLPDCDAKYFALILSARLTQLYNDDKTWAEPRLTAIVENCSNCGHSYIMRETCVEVLQIILPDLCNLNKRKERKQSLLNAMSALIKLSQDEEYQIRQKCHQIVSDLLVLQQKAEKPSDSDRPAHVTSPIDSFGRLGKLVSLITERLFRPSNTEELIICLQLSLRIIFDHSKDCSIDINGEKEQLFDKTKLNTFADHVATIQSVLISVRSVIESCGNIDRPDVESVKISNETRFELTNSGYLDKQKKLDTSGDYSWRIKLSKNPINQLSENNHTTTPTDNRSLVEQTLKIILHSLSYFTVNYWNMLTDTEYTYHELALLKRIAFVKFVMSFTSYSPSDVEILDRIRSELENLVGSLCSTTMLCKCLELMREKAEPKQGASVE